MNSHDVQFNILLNSPINEIVDRCVNKSAINICNSQEFWSRKYIHDGIDPPHTLNYTFQEHLLYYRTMQYYNDAIAGTLLIIEFPDTEIATFDISDRDLLSLLVEIYDTKQAYRFIYLQGDTFYQFNVTMFILEDDSGESIEMERITRETLFKLLQYALLKQFKIFRPDPYWIQKYNNTEAKKHFKLIF